MGKKVKIVTSGASSFKTANIVTSASGYGGGVETLDLLTSGDIAGEVATVIAAPSLIKGAKTLCVPAYSPGGGGSTYAAKAVHFDGNTSIRCASLSVTDSSLLSFSRWALLPNPILNQQTEWATDPQDNFYGNESLTAQQFLGFTLSKGNRFAAVTSQQISPLGQWLHIAGNADCGHPAGEKTWQLYVNEELFSLGTMEDFGFDAFVPFYNGFPFFVGDDTFGDPLIGDRADWWFAVGQLVDFSDTATMRKFRSADGKPVDLGADGSTPTGTAPTVFFSGNASAFGTNKGTGGTFSVTGALTNASTSPSD